MKSWYQSINQSLNTSPSRPFNGKKLLRFEPLENRLCLSAIHGMVWHDLNSDGEHDRFVAGSEPDVVMVVDVSSSTQHEGPKSKFGFVGTAGQEAIERSGSTEWVTVEDGHHFLNPVIIASPVRYDTDNPAADSDPALARIANVAASASGLSFDLQVDEWEYCDDLHTEEIVNYLIIEAGQHMLDDGTIIEAGTFEVDSNGTWVSFRETFGADAGTSAVTPVILTQVMSYNETDAVTVRVDNASFTGFKATLREEGATTGTHATETVGYIAISKPGTAAAAGQTLKADNAWTKFQYGTVDVVNTAQDPDYTLTYASGHFGAEAPLIFASMQTTNESDAGTALRFEDATAASVTLRIEDDHAGYHASEEVGFFAIHEGDIWVNVDGAEEGGDNEIDTIFEAEVVAVKAVRDHLIEQGLGDVADVVVVTYNDAAWYLDMHRQFSGYPETYGIQFHATPNETCYVDLTGPYGVPDYVPDDPDGDRRKIEIAWTPKFYPPSLAFNALFL